MSGSVKTVLAFGDSLTWGADAQTGGRHRYEDRWPTVLEQQLGGEVRVIAEGLSGRTTSMDDHASLADLNGARALPMLLARRWAPPLACAGWCRS